MASSWDAWHILLLAKGPYISTSCGSHKAGVPVDGHTAALNKTLSEVMEALLEDHVQTQKGKSIMLQQNSLASLAGMFAMLPAPV